MYGFIHHNNHRYLSLVFKLTPSQCQEQIVHITIRISGHWNTGCTILEPLQLIGKTNAAVAPYDITVIKMRLSLSLLSTHLFFIFYFFILTHHGRESRCSSSRPNTNLAKGVPLR